MTFDDMYELISECVTEKQLYAIEIHTDICGNTIESLNDCIYAMFGYRTCEQFLDSEYGIEVC